MSTTGTPSSSIDLKDSQGVKQRRYYDKDGKADLDIDYRHAGNYQFPHRHTWSMELEVDIKGVGNNGYL